MLLFFSVGADFLLRRSSKVRDQKRGKENQTAGSQPDAGGLWLLLLRRRLRHRHHDGSRGAEGRWKSLNFVFLFPLLLNTTFAGVK